VGIVTKHTTVHFNCPSCNALYQVVRTEVGRRLLIVGSPVVIATDPSRPAKANSGSNIFFCGNRDAQIGGHDETLSGHFSTAQPWAQLGRSSPPCGRSLSLGQSWLVAELSNLPKLMQASARDPTPYRCHVVDPLAQHLIIVGITFGINLHACYDDDPCVSCAEIIKASKQGTQHRYVLALIGPRRASDATHLPFGLPL